MFHPRHFRFRSRSRFHFGPRLCPLPPGSRRLFFALLVVALVLQGLGIGQSHAQDDARGTAEDTPPTVRLVIDFADGFQKHYTEIPWREGMTVWDVVQAAAKHPRGIEVKHRGEGATLLVTQIDGVQNQAGSGKNWIYRVNDEVARRSAGIEQVKRADTVLWRFETYR